MTPGQAAYEARQAAKARRMGGSDSTPDSELVAIIGLRWEELPAGMQADEEAAAQAAIGHAGDGLAKLRDAFALLEKVAWAQERALYATWIEIGQHKSRDGALLILGEALDGYDGPEWNGTESGVGWLERARREAQTPGAQPGQQETNQEGTK